MARHAGGTQPGLVGAIFALAIQIEFARMSHETIDLATPLQSPGHGATVGTPKLSHNYFLLIDFFGKAVDFTFDVL